MSQPFIVHAASLRKVAGTIRREVRSGVIQGLGTVSVVVPEGAEVEARVTLSSYPGGIMATGRVSAPWQGECRRCGGVITGAVEAEVCERFVIRASGSGVGADGAMEDDAYVVAEDVLDLEPLARDAVLLELPLAPLCAEDCRGLCPRCGVDLNLEACSCKPEPDPRWSDLDTLRLGDGGA
ncbi:MAG: YceD family protein [Acidimicrobiales bacterium]